MRIAIPVLLLPLVVPLLLAGYLSLSGSTPTLQTLVVPSGSVVVPSGAAVVCWSGARPPC